MKPRPAATLLALAALAAACRNDQITVQRVPKENEAVAALAAPAPGGHREVDWTVPAGWTEQPASGMRVGSFIVDNDGGNVDVSVITLSGEAGGELANVNRWLDQLKLPPVDEAGLSKIVTSRKIGPHDARLVEFANGQGQRLLAAVVRQGRATWFFKATGPDRAVRAARDGFLTFVGSARFHRHE